MSLEFLVRACVFMLRLSFGCEFEVGVEVKPEENATEAQLGSGGLRGVPYSYRDMPKDESGDVEVEFEVCGSWSSSSSFYVAVEFLFEFELDAEFWF